MVALDVLLNEEPIATLEPTWSRRPKAGVSPDLLRRQLSTTLS